MKYRKKTISIVMALIMIVTLIPAQIFAVSAEAPHMTSLTVVKRTAPKSTSINVTWKKTADADGYALYRAESQKGSYKKIAATKSLSYTDKRLKTGKTYYYKVRTYRDVNGKRIYSLACMPKSVKMTYIHPVLKVSEYFDKLDGETVTSPYGIIVWASSYDEPVYLVTSINRPFYQKGKVAAVLCKDAAVKGKDKGKRVYFKYDGNIYSYDKKLKINSTGKKAYDFDYTEIQAARSDYAGVALQVLPGSNVRHNFEKNDMIKFYVMYRNQLYVVKYDKINGVRTQITN